MDGRVHDEIPLRVLVVGIGWPMETFLERLIVGLATSGSEIHLLSSSRPPDRWLSEHGISWRFGARRFRLWDLGAQARRDGVVTAMGTAVRSRRSLATSRDRAHLPWDVVYAPWVTTIMAHEHLFHLGIPVVTSCRGALISVAPWHPAQPEYRSELQAAFDAATLVHCVSDRILEDAVEVGLDPEKARVIRPAVDVAGFAARSSNRSDATAVRVVAVGGVTWRKDFEHAVLALRMAIDAGADLELRIVGDGEDAQHVRFAIDDLSLTDRVTLVGRRSPAEVRAELEAADIFLHTSSSEGISNAVLEAMASSLPVITTDAGGMREAVRDEIDGFVVGVRKAEQTAAALSRLAADHELRSQMGAAGHARVAQDFQLADQILSFARLLQDAAGR